METEENKNAEVLNPESKEVGFRITELVEAKTEPQQIEKKTTSTKKEPVAKKEAAVVEVDPFAEAERLFDTGLQEKLPEDIDPLQKELDNITGLPDNIKTQLLETAKAKTAAEKSFRGLLDNYQTKEQEWQNWAQQVAEARQQDQIQLAELRARVEMMSKGYSQQHKIEEDPYKQLQGDFLSEADKRTKELLENSLKPLQEKLTAYETREKQAAEQRERYRKSEEYRKAAEVEVVNRLLNGFAPEVVQELSAPLSAMVIRNSLVNNVPFAASASALEKMLLGWSKNYIRAKAAQMKNSTGLSQETQKTLASSRGESATKGRGVPSGEDSIKRGFKDPLDEMVKTGVWIS